MDWLGQILLENHLFSVLKKCNKRECIASHFFKKLAQSW
jgi:5-methylcytosine-specific restriction endonuclease McrBC regulatory subunit McrC